MLQESKTTALREHLQELQKRNHLLKKLLGRAAEFESLAKVERIADEASARSQVKNAQQKCTEHGEVYNNDRERLLEHTQRARPTPYPRTKSTAVGSRRPLAATEANTRRALAATDINISDPHGSKLLRPKLRLSDIKDKPREAGCHTSRDRGSQSFSVWEPGPATARPSAQPSVDDRVPGAGWSSSRYETLVTLLNLQDEGGSPGEEPTLPEFPQAWVNSRRGQDLNEGEMRPRAQSAPMMGAGSLQAEAKARLKAEGGVGRRSLPGSPRWTDDMNPSQQPDGDFSMEKMCAFQKGMRNLLRTLRWGGTVLETRVQAKRSKASQDLTQQERREGVNAFKGAINSRVRCGRQHPKLTRR